MAGYGDFAEFYDLFTENVDYNGCATYLGRLFDRFADTSPQMILDLACGTGSLSRALLERGIEVIGVDGSPDMLAKAAEKNAAYADRLLLLCQDMRALDLFGTVDGAVCMLDSLNHLTKTADLREVFRRLGLFIRPGGLLIFDVNTPYKHRTVLGNTAFTYERGGVFCAWQNHYLPHTGETVIHLDFFLPQGDLYERYSETVRERAYSMTLLRRILKETGFSVLAEYAEGGLDAPTPTTERVVFVAKNLAIEQEQTNG